MNYTGHYICKSEVANSNASIYATTMNPLFELVSPGMEYFPIGAEINSLTVRYGDSSVGYMQLGSGFTYNLTFSSPMDIIEERAPQINTLIDSTATRSNETFIEYSVMARSTGIYSWRGKYV